MDSPLTTILGIDAAAYPDLERYVIRGVIGEGGMGRVFDAHDRKLDRAVAVKVLQNQDDATMNERFYREAKIAAALNHPNIIRVIDYSGTDLPQQFIVMERLLGRSLQALVEEAPLSELIACVIGHEVSRGLAHAHEAGMIHRDVKPENIFVEPDGRVVLIDFGLAKGNRSGGDRDTFIGSKTELIGTPLFGSPEQCTGSAALTYRSDLFSLGSVLYFATTQVYPFQGDSLNDVLDRLTKKQPLPLDRLIQPSVDFKALVEHLMKKDPADRPASADVVSERLEKLLVKHKVVSARMTLYDWQNGIAAHEESPTVISKTADHEETRIVTMNIPRQNFVRVTHLPAWTWFAALGILLAALVTFFMLVGKRQERSAEAPRDALATPPAPLPLPEPPRSVNPADLPPPKNP